MGEKDEEGIKRGVGEKGVEEGTGKRIESKRKVSTRGREEKERRKRGEREEVVETQVNVIVQITLSYVLRSVSVVNQRMNNQQMNKSTNEHTPERCADRMKYNLRLQPIPRIPQGGETRH